MSYKVGWDGSELETLECPFEKRISIGMIFDSINNHFEIPCLDLVRFMTLMSSDIAFLSRMHDDETAIPIRLDLYSQRRDSRVYIQARIKDE